MKQNIAQLKKHSKPTLYWLVFEAVQTKCFVFFLLLFFLVQPAAPVFAAEEISDDQSIAEADVQAEVAPALVTEPEVTEVEAAPPPAEVVVVENTDSILPAETTGQALEAEANAEQSVIDVLEPTDDELIGSESESEVVVAESDNVLVAEVGTTDEITDNYEVEAPTEEVPTDQTEEVGEPQSPVEEVDIAVTASSAPTQIVYVDRRDSDPNIITFDVSNCASVGDGSYYCSKRDTGQIKELQTGVFSAQDGSGDMEVYLNTDGETKQLSNNAYDDLAPDYDLYSDTVVWHRLIDGSYQIVVYDVKKESETVITNEGMNMEPTHENGITVWQRWQNGNWEIVMNDGQAEKQLTHNGIHDVAPDIRNGFVMWNTGGAGGDRQVSVYEIATGLTSTIADSDGGQVTNPRFVLVYDTKFANGDIITKGFNPSTGQVEALAAMPADLPKEIPPSDQTGETRALIQNKSSSSKGDGSELSPEEESNANGTSDLNATSTNSNATSSDSSVPPDLDLSGTASTTLPLTDFDLIVEPFSSSTSSQVNDSGTTTNPVE